MTASKLIDSFFSRFAWTAEHVRKDRTLSWIFSKQNDNRYAFFLVLHSAINLPSKNAGDLNSTNNICPIITVGIPTCRLQFWHNECNTPDLKFQKTTHQLNWPLLPVTENVYYTWIADRLHCSTQLNPTSSPWLDKRNRRLVSNVRRLIITPQSRRELYGHLNTRLRLIAA